MIDTSLNIKKGNYPLTHTYYSDIFAEEKFGVLLIKTY